MSKLLKFFLPFLIFLLVGSRVVQAQDDTVTIVISGGEVKIVRIKEGKEITVDKIRETDRIIIKYECPSFEYQVEAYYSSKKGKVTITHSHRTKPNGSWIPDRPVSGRISFDEFKEVLKNYIIKIQEFCGETRSRSESCRPCTLLKLSTEIFDFSTLLFDGSVFLNWKTDNEENNAGFFLWRGIESDIRHYRSHKPILLGNSDFVERVDPGFSENCSIEIWGQLKEIDFTKNYKPIYTLGNSVDRVCYSFVDTTNLSDGTYYYLLEDIDDGGKSTFHCDHIDAVTIGQGPPVDLPSAIDYCKKETGSED